MVAPLIAFVDAVRNCHRIVARIVKDCKNSHNFGKALDDALAQLIKRFWGFELKYQGN